MQQYGRSQFADRFAEVAADGDYSRIPRLQGTTQYDIRAAAEAMWAAGTKRGWDREEMGRVLDVATVERVLLAKVSHFSDGNHLVSVEFEEYWDATDKQGFSFGLRETIQEGLVRNYENRKRQELLTVVNNQNGIWVFDLKEAM